MSDNIMNSYKIYVFWYIYHTDNKLSDHDHELKKASYLIPVFVCSVIFESTCQYFKYIENRFVQIDNDNNIISIFELNANALII